MKKTIITTTLILTIIVMGLSQNNSLDFDGVNDIVSMPNSPSLTVDAELTMEAWVNPYSNGVYRMILNKEGEYELAIHNGNIAFAVNISGDWDWIITSEPVPLNTWTHIAVTYDGSNYKAYKNGIEIYNESITGIIGDFEPANNDLTIGFRMTPYISQYFHGQIDNVMIWDIARNQSEIQSDMNGLTLCNSSGLSGFWDFNQGIACGNNTSINMLFDCTSNSNDGAITNFTLNGNTSNFKSGASALPVELIDFNSQIINDKIVLNWTTASELNNLGFNIQKSKNGRDWQIIDFAEGRGTTSEFNEYDYIDTNPFLGINYYRLKQIDFDGAFEYSKVIAIEYNNSEKNIQVYPNPSNRLINIQIDNPSNQRMTIKITDNLGRTVWGSGLIESESNWRKEMEVEGNGIYFIVAQVGDEVFYERVIITDEK